MPPLTHLHYAAVCGLAWFGCLIGCGGGRPGIVPVSGQVSIDGKPVTRGQIMVFPEGHRASIGKLNEEGHFTLSCFEPGDGAPIGQHIATVTAVESIDEHTNRWHVPKQYANKATGVWVTIDGPTDDLKLDLTWGNAGPKAPFTEKF